MPEVFVHPVPRDHGAGDIGSLDQIVGRPGRDMIVDDLLCRAPAKQDCDLVLEFLPRHQEAVLGRALDGVAERANPARYDRDLVHRVHPRQSHRHQRVPHLVVRHDLAFARIEHAVLLFQPRDDAFDGIVEVVHRHRISLAARGEQCCLVDEIGKIRAGKAGSKRCDLLGIDVWGERHFLHVHVQDLHTPRLVGPIHQHLTVEASRTQQRGVENLGSVGGGQEHDAHCRVEAVELGQKLVQRLLTLIMATGDLAGGARPPKSVEFVDEDDCRGRFPGLLEQVAHPCGTDAHEHLDEL